MLDSDTLLLYVDKARASKPLFLLPILVLTRSRSQPNMAPRSSTCFLRCLDELVNAGPCNLELHKRILVLDPI